MCSVLVLLLAAGCGPRWFTLEPASPEIHLSAPNEGENGDRNESTAVLFRGTSEEALAITAVSLDDQDIWVGLGTNALVLPDEDVEGALWVQAWCDEDTCAEPGTYRYGAEVRVFVCTGGAEVARATGACDHGTDPDDTVVVDVTVVLEDGR